MVLSNKNINICVHIHPQNITQFHHLIYLDVARNYIQQHAVGLSAEEFPKSYLHSFNNL